MSATELRDAVVPGVSRTRWLFPADDQDTLTCWFRRGLFDVNPSLEMAEPYLAGHRSCVQAGGAIGVWPIRLSQVFDTVITCEPESTNWDCLTYNTRDIPNIHPMKIALGDREDLVSMHLKQSMAGHCGAWYVQKNGNITLTTIDSTVPKTFFVDLIYLDIEGYEYHALKGAQNTIQRCRPVIGLEDKSLNRKNFNEHNSAMDLLKQWGYQFIGRPHKTDVIMAPKERT
jgi:FkbM family methyltransferase